MGDREEYERTFGSRWLVADKSAREQMREAYDKAARDPIPRHMRARHPFVQTDERTVRFNHRLTRLILCLCLGVFVVLVPLLLSVRGILLEPIALTVTRETTFEVVSNGVFVRELVIMCGAVVVECWNQTQCTSTAPSSSSSVATEDIPLQWAVPLSMTLGAAPSECTGADGYTVRLEHTVRWTVVAPLLLLCMVLLVLLCVWCVVYPETHLCTLCCGCPCCRWRRCCCFGSDYESIVEHRHVLSLSDADAGDTSTDW